MSLARGDPRHGTRNGYNNQGCRCPRCRAASTAYLREHGYGSYAKEPCPDCGAAKQPDAALCQKCRDAEREAPHGTATRYKRCRCDECKRASADARRRRRHANRVECSHGCGTLVDPYNARYPGKPPECRACAVQRINAAQKAKAAA